MASLIRNGNSAQQWFLRLLKHVWLFSTKFQVCVIHFFHQCKIVGELQKQDVIEEKEDLKADETKEDALENVIEQKEQNVQDPDQGYIYIKFAIMSWF